MQFSGSGSSPAPVGNNPVIGAIAPDSAPELWTVTITGQDFGAAQGDVTFADIDSPAVSSWTNTVIVCDIPADISRSRALVDVVVTADAKASTPYGYTVIKTYYVDANNGDDENTGTLDEPFQTITHAVDTAGEGEAINISEGTYNEGIGETFPLEPKDGMILRGGFQTGFQNNDPATYMTYIDPENNSGAIYIYRSAPMNKEKNGIDNISLVGLDIINGASDEGGGIDCLNFAGTLLVLECEVSNCTSVNFSGGGLYIHNSNFYMSDSNVSGNNSNFVGGGLVINDSQVTIENSIINGNNSSDAGGGIYLSNNSTLNLTDSVIQENVSNNSDGGGIYSDVNSDLTLTGSNIYNNTADGYGGGIAYYNSTGSLTITNSQIAGNDGGYGGGIYLYGADAQVNNSAIGGNNSGYHGGGFWISDNSTVTIGTCAITDNYAARDGAGIYAENNTVLQVTYTTISDNFGSGNYWGGGLAGYDISLTMTGCSVTGNHTVSSGGGLCLNDSQGTVSDTEIADNSAGGGHGGGVAVRNNTVNYMNFENCEIMNNDTTNRGGGVYLSNCRSWFTNCLVTGNSSQVTGGGFSVMGTLDFDLLNSTVDSNAAVDNTFGGGIFFDATAQGVDIENCIFSNNTAATGSGIYASAGPNIEIHYCNVWNNVVENITQVNCIAVNPLYTGALSQEYTVDDTSQVIDAGDPAYAGVLINGNWETQLNTPDVTPVDIGFHYPFP
ncbi:MAG: right-handed parallel beta-helix repeat-containing protein [Chloroflexi bacterium]|nr:right-handed parallel beta-helix repeat-containing protein [Chloroflexota bacterium]